MRKRIECGTHKVYIWGHFLPMSMLLRKYRLGSNRSTRSLRLWSTYVRSWLSSSCQISLILLCKLRVLIGYNWNSSLISSSSKSILNELQVLKIAFSATIREILSLSRTKKFCLYLTYSDIFCQSDDTKTRTDFRTNLTHWETDETKGFFF